MQCSGPAPPVAVLWTSRPCKCLPRSVGPGPLLQFFCAGNNGSSINIVMTELTPGKLMPRALTLNVAQRSAAHYIASCSSCPPPPHPTPLAFPCALHSPTHPPTHPHPPTNTASLLPAAVLDFIVRNPNPKDFVNRTLPADFPIKVDEDAETVTGGVGIRAGWG